MKGGSRSQWELVKWEICSGPPKSGPHCLLALTAMAKTTSLSHMCCIGVVKLLFLYISWFSKENLSLFNHWVWQLWVLHIWHWLCQGNFLQTCWVFFIIKGCWMFSVAFSALVEMVVFFPFTLLMWCVIPKRFPRLKHSCIPGINPTFSWLIFFIIWIDMNNYYINSCNALPTSVQAFWTLVDWQVIFRMQHWTTEVYVF